jgi:hypothetical protein
MSDIERRLQEHRAMRDAAREVVQADIGVVRGEVQERGIAQRAADGVSATSHSMADRAVGFVREHPVAVGGGVLALLLILFRGFILDLLIDLLEDDEDEQDQVDEELDRRAVAPLPAVGEAEPAQAADRSSRT